MRKKGKLSQLRRALADSVGSEKVIYDPDVLGSYARDETSDLVNSPDLVVRASCTRDVSETLRLCSHYNIPVTPRGAGTGVTGGAAGVGFHSAMGGPSHAATQTAVNPSRPKPAPPST